MTILPITYLGGVEWFSHLLCDGAAGGCVIDVGENWVKQTARNRCEIMTSGGTASLTVPVHGGGSAGGPHGGAKVATKEVRIDNSKRWQHVHWMALVSAYRNSPFFEHYEERFAPIYTARRFEFLVDLNLALLEIVLAALRVEGLGAGAGSVPKISETWVEAAAGDLDLRGKKALRRVGSSSCRAEEEYTQVFSDRMAFVPGLSIVDLLFCEGPLAGNLLRARV